MRFIHAKDLGLRPASAINGTCHITKVRGNAFTLLVHPGDGYPPKWANVQS